MSRPLLLLTRLPSLRLPSLRLPKLLSKNRSNRGAFALGLTLWLSPFSALATDKWYVEFSDPNFEESVVRRAVALELREIDIPADPRVEEQSADDVSLRVLVTRDEKGLSVGLWDRGEYVGRRHVSASSQARVLARRIGLAVSELGRGLAARRRRLSQKMERDAFLEQERIKERQAALRLRDIGLRAEGQTIIFPQGGYLVGPALGAEFNQYYPVRFNLGLSWLAGGLPPLADDSLGGLSPRWSSFDLWFHADHLTPLHHDQTLTLGGLVALSAVHVGGATEVDDIESQRDTYSARLGGRLGWQYAVTELIRFRAEASAGSVLRSIPIRHSGGRLDLGGAFVGFTLGATIAPAGKTP